MTNQVTRAVNGIKSLLSASQITGSEHVDREGLEIALQATAVVEAVETLLKHTAEVKLALATSDVALNVAEAERNAKACAALTKAYRRRLRTLRVS